MRQFTTTAGLFFTLIFAVWLTRMILGVPVRVNGFDVPVSMTIIPLVITGGFAVWAFRLLRTEAAR